MRFRASAFAAVFLLFAAAWPMVGRAAEGPQEMMERISGSVLAQAKADEDIQRGDRKKTLALVRREILPYIDFDRMTELAAGRYWEQATPQQRQRLTQEFGDLLVHVYSGAIAQVRDKEIVFQRMRGDPASGDVEVRSKVLQRQGAEPIELNYRLWRGPAGWKIYDVGVLGVWLVQSYRPSFAQIISGNGIDGLIAMLEEKNDRLAAGLSAGSRGQ